MANEQLMNDEEIWFALRGMMMMCIVSLPSHRPIASMVGDCEILSSVPTALCMTIYVCWNAEDEARSDAVGWGTTLQAGRLRVRFPIRSLEFFMNTILPPAIWPWGHTEMCARNISLGVRADGAYGWQPYHLHVPIVMKCGRPQHMEPSGLVQAWTEITLSDIRLTVHHWYK